MIRINLLPYREMRRERRRKAFAFLAGVTAAGSAAVALLVALGIQVMVDTQQERNDFIRRENARLDAEIKEIATLRQEIEALRARQEAVETLQRDRTLPVHLFDELVRLTPEGLQIKQIKQVGSKVTLNGVAQSNDRVSALLRSLANDTRWLERPELVEIKAVILGKPDPRKKVSDERRAYQFSLRVAVRAKDADETPPAAAAKGRGGKAASAKQGGR